MKDAIARFAIRNTAPILFLVFAVCLGGAYAALHMPSSVFPQVNFPRVVILVNNGVHARRRDDREHHATHRRVDEGHPGMPDDSIGHRGAGRRKSMSSSPGTSTCSAASSMC